MIKAQRSPSAMIIFVLILLLAFSAISTDAAAGYPLTRPEMMFEPLSCNSHLEDPDLDCSTSLESLIDATAPGDNVVVPCGMCATLTSSDGSWLNLTASLDVQGMLLVPASAQAILRTTAVFVQGKLQIDPPSNVNGLKVSLYGVDDVFFTPHDENAAKCPPGGCNVSSKAIVAAGGQFDIRGDQIAAEGSTCKTWTTLRDAITTHPILPNDPVCRADGSPLEIGADGSFEGGSTGGFVRYRSGSISLANDNLVPDNTYLLNTGRANVKDGISILSGDHQTCLMRNRLYEIKIKYRLELEGEHRPQIMLHVGDRDNDNQRVIAYESLPTSINGTWASATVQFDSRDIPDLGHFYIRVNWPTSANATAGYDDISILPINTNPPGKPDVLFVDPSTAACWAPKVGNTLLVTSNEIGQLKTGWNSEDLATIESIDVTTGAIKLLDPLNHYKTTEAQDWRFATELAVLHRSTVFEAEKDNPLDYIGGHSIVLHTAAKQHISGAAFYGFGQQGELGRYPIHFHMSGDHFSSVVSKNLVQDSKQRCYVIHGTDGVRVEYNVAYDTIGHCYMNENGVEEDIQFIGNLGALTKRQSQERLIGESDHRAYTFWFTNANVRVEGNVAAGANLGGYWYETFERGPHGPYALWPEYADFNPKTRPLGSFIDNVVHSSGERGIRMYEPGYKPLEEFTFFNTRSYKNFGHGIFIHGVQKMTMDGGVLADNAINIRNFNDRTVFRNLELMGTSDLVRERSPNNCHARTGLQQRVNPGWNDGAILDNVTFSGLNKGYACGQTGIEFYHLTNVKLFQGNPHFYNIRTEPGTDRKDLLQIDCKWSVDPYNMKNIIVEDRDGTIGLTGSPGFYVMNDQTVLSWIQGAMCMLDNSCGVYCDNVCLRNVQVHTPGCNVGESCFDHIMMISDGVHNVTYERHVDQSDNKKDLYEAVLPKGNYEILFYDQGDNLVEGITPADITIEFGDKPHCSDYVQEGDIGLQTHAPTAAPTSTNPPIHSSAILTSTDPIVKLGTSDNSRDPKLAIDGTTSEYLVYTTDFKTLPCFSVAPSQPTIVQELKIYTPQTRYKKDPRTYKLEGRKSPNMEWTMIKEGIFPTNNNRNTIGENITDTSHYFKVMFENTIAYNEYRVWFPTNRGNNYYVAMGDVQFGGFFVSGIDVQLTSPFPAGAVCDASTQCKTEECNGEGICV